MKLAATIFISATIAIGCTTACNSKRTDNPEMKALSSFTTRLPDYEKGEALFGTKNDSAFYLFNKVVGSAKDSLQVGNAYNRMAAIQFDAGDYFGAQESLLLSLKTLDEHNENHSYCLSSDYNELGNTSFNLKNYAAAIGYYDVALQFIKDDNFRAMVVNNKASSYQKKREYATALMLYDRIASQSELDPKKKAMVLTNIATTKWLMDSNYYAAPELLTALQMRTKGNDNWGLNSSYAHLSDYYARSKPDSAFIYAEKMYNIAVQLGSPDDELEALQKLIALSPGKNVKIYFHRYYQLQDSLQTARNNAKNQFALIRYDAEKNKADNLLLQKENAEKKLQIVWQRVFLYSVVFILLSGAGVTIAWYRKRKRKMEQEAQSKIRESQLKTSQKVHDVVANGLYRIMTDIEHKNELSKDELLDSIENLYERSRDISYEAPLVANAAFDTTVAALLTSFASPITKILITGNNSDIWNGLSVGRKQELKLVLEELMVNMKKHSGAENVVIKFEQIEKQINIQYADDGVGFAPSTVYGNGLTNTGNRMKAIGGRIIFDRSSGKGLKIRLNVPINHP